MKNTISVIAIKPGKGKVTTLEIGKIYEVSKEASEILVSRKLVELVEGSK